MKHLTTILAAVLLLAAFVGIVLDIYYAVNNNKDYIGQTDYRGHRYVLVHANGSTGITHGPNCPCLKNTDKETVNPLDILESSSVNEQ